MEASHPLILKYMEMVKRSLTRQTYKGKNRAHFGPPMLTKMFKKFCSKYLQPGKLIDQNGKCINIAYTSKYYESYLLYIAFVRFQAMS